MEIKYYKISPSGLEAYTPAVPGAVETHVPVWISIFANDRREIPEQVGDIINDHLAMQLVLESGHGVRIKFTDRWGVLDFKVIVENASITTDTITFLAGENMLITIADKARAALTEITADIQAFSLPADDELLHLIYLLFHELSSDNMQVVANARQRVEMLAETINKQPHDLEPADIMNTKGDLGIISGVLEDEHLSLSHLALLRFRVDSAKYRELLAEIADGLGQLKKSIERAEDRLESIHLHYILTLQDITNRRLSTLTVLQAIFVPLTLIAGIYGMNFVYMPELQWELSYFWILGLMVFIAGCELFYFYTRGWFK